MALPEKELRDPDRIGENREGDDNVVPIGWGEEWRGSRHDPVAQTIEFTEVGTPASITAPTAREAAWEARDPLDPSTEEVPAKATSRRGFKGLIGAAVVGLIATGGTLVLGQDEGDGKVTAPNRPVAGATPLSAENDQEVSAIPDVVTEVTTTQPPQGGELPPELREQAELLALYDAPIGSELTPTEFTRSVLADWMKKVDSLGGNATPKVQIVDGLVLIIEDTSTGTAFSVDRFIAYGKVTSPDGSYSFTPTPENKDPKKSAKDLVLVYLDPNGEWHAIAMMYDGANGWNTDNPSFIRVSASFLDGSRGTRPSLNNGVLVSVTPDSARVTNSQGGATYNSFVFKPGVHFSSASEAVASTGRRTYLKPMSIAATTRSLR